MRAARHALEAWSHIAGRLRRARHVALFTDFDGTLARIRRHPHQASLPARARELLRELAGMGVTVGVVSGRRVRDVRRHVGLRHIWYAGSHGFFLLDPGNHAIRLANAKQNELMKRVEKVLAQRLRGLPGIRLEPKQPVVTVHYRGTTARSARLARDAVREMMSQHPEMCLLSGKKVWGLLPDSSTDKWAAISYILRRERRRAPRGRWLAIFLGDDATDERVFKKMSGISIAVGRKHGTGAQYYLRSPAEVKRFLERLKQALA